MNIENIKLKKEDLVIIKKKTIIFLSIMIIAGLITGLILSNFFYNEANQKIDNWNERMDEWYQNWDNDSWGNHNSSGFSWNISNTSFSNSNSNSYNLDRSWYNPYLDHLTNSDIILPSLGVIGICITIYLLLGLIFSYIKIFILTKSTYIQGLMFVLIPMFIIQLFLLNIIRSLYFSSVFRYDYLGNALGFGIGGLGSIISILSIFQIIGLIIMFYLANE